MIFDTYEQYKESGLEWLPKIPLNWSLVDLRRGIELLTDFEANGSFAEVKKNVVLDTNEKYAWYLRATDLQNKRGGISDEVRTCDKKAYDYLTKTQLFGGEFLVAKRGEVGKIYVVPELSCKATLAPNLYLIRLNEKLHIKYVYYWFSSSYGKPELFLADKSTTIGALYKDDVRACKILLPSISEQQKIANFLDHETAKIDTLIEKQQQLIKLLKEKRQAVISHAVTKGLNPDVPMRDSGVEWLGEVPEHWVVTRAKFVSEVFIPQRNKPELNDSEGIPWATMEDMKAEYIETTRKYVSDQALKAAGSKILKADSVIASCVGSFGVASINTIDVVINQQLQAFVPNGIKSEYLRELVSISTVYFELIGTAATLVYVNQQGFEGLPAVVPPFSEQTDICLKVDEVRSKYNTLIAKSEDAINLLKERRTALISAAVTGKIDVRNWQPPKPASNETKEASL